MDMHGHTMDMENHSMGMHDHTLGIDNHDHDHSHMMDFRSSDEATATPFCGGSMMHDMVNGTHQGGMGMTMYMDGFHSSLFSSPSLPCLNLFSSSWTLNSRAKFVLAMAGVYFMGFSTECLSAFVRRRQNDRLRNDKKRRQGMHAVTQSNHVDALLHLLQVLFGYLDMLVVMTFSTELFLSIAIGFASGRAYLNIYRCTSTVEGGETHNEEHTSTGRETDASTATAGTIPCCDFLEEVLLADEEPRSTEEGYESNHVRAPLLGGGGAAKTGTVVRRRSKQRAAGGMAQMLAL
jgi:hypothetical protein